MQSGLSRWVLERAHGIGNEITNLKSDGLNSMLISISKNEKKIKFWEILDHSLIKEFIIESFPRQLEINRDSDLICVSLEKNNIYIYDKSQLALVRKFNIIFNEENYVINDIGISKDSNWLLCITSNDKSLRIYDIISTNLIEWVKFDKIPLSMNLSPNSLYIALSFLEEKGIYLYINRTLFVDLEDIETVTEPVQCTLATFKAKMIKQRDEYNINEDNNDDNIEEKENDERKKYIEIPEENNKLISLSSENNIKYKLLNDIELLQERNAPKIKEKKKEQAPFFLFNINDVIEGQLPTKESKDSKQEKDESPEFINLLKNYSHFNNEKKITEKKFIHSFHNKNNKGDNTLKEMNLKIKSEDNKEGYILSQLLVAFKNKKIKSWEITKFLNGLNPYISDLEIRSLDPLFTIGEENYLLLFTEYILNEFKNNNNNFEMLQAYLNRFIKIYSDDIVNDKEIKNNLDKINEINKQKFDELENIYNTTMCLVPHFGNIQI
jgi:U3 small nucleolar RNA-associated protein 21